MDYFTKFKILIPCQTTDTAPDFVQHYIDSVFPYFGLPGSVVSDRGSTFVAHFTLGLWKQLSVKAKPSTAYHPQTNGQTERANQELEQYLRFYCDYGQENWSNLLPMAQFVLNCRYHSSIGATPFQMMLGFTPKWNMNPSLQSDVPAAKETANALRIARENAIHSLEKAAEIMKEHYD